MKRLVALVLVVFAVAAVTTTATASGPTVVSEGFSCGVLDGNGSTFITTDSVVILYASGKVVLKCNGNGAPAASLTFYNFDNTGLSCNVPGYGSTTDWLNKVGKAGNSQLTCTTHAVDDARASAGGAGIG
jgi:hypothetical protein